MPTNVTVTTNLQWTPPSAPVNSGNASMSVVASINAQNVGSIDVQTTDTSPTTFAIPFGSISAAKVLLIKNMMSSDISVRLNGDNADTFRIPSGGAIHYAAPATPGSVPISSVTVITTVTPTQVETIHYFVFGD